MRLGLVLAVGLILGGGSWCAAQASDPPYRSKSGSNKGGATPAARTGSAKTGPAPVVERIERVIGPLQVGEQQFTVRMRVVQAKVPYPPQNGDQSPSAGVTASEQSAVSQMTQESVEWFAIRDAAGNVVYQQSNKVTVDPWGIDRMIGVQAQVLESGNGTGLLLTYGEEPSSPLGGTSVQVFAVKESKLAPVSSAILFDGRMLELAKGSAPQSVRLLEGDMLKFKLWTGHFFVTVPLRVNLSLGRIWSRCVGPCTLEVQADRVAHNRRTFVRLFPEPREDSRPQHVVLETTSRVEFLEASTEVTFANGAEYANIGIDESPWLKLRIDGVEGWIRADEDLEAVGLPQAD